MILQEGTLQFSFNETCHASKYDEWSFYRRHFQKCGLSKAVDLLCIDSDLTWLIEVKDYRYSRRTKPIDLSDEIVAKVRDTLAGLVAAKINANDPAEKDFAKRALRSRAIKVVLHLEQPQLNSRLSPQVYDVVTLTQKLRQQLRALDAHSKVVNKHNLSHNMGWIVTE